MQCSVSGRSLTSPALYHSRVATAPGLCEHEVTLKALFLHTLAVGDLVEAASSGKPPAFPDVWFSRRFSRMTVMPSQASDRVNGPFTLPIIAAYAAIAPGTPLTVTEPDGTR